jgi:CubicO group peptidase (beta-lactamase class C family)
MPTMTQSARRRALEPAFALARTQVETGTVPFVVLGVANRDGVIRIEASSGRPGRRIGTNAVCLLASITKPIVASAVVQAVEAGRIAFDDVLGSWAPDILNPRWAPITPWHVLTHTTGIEDIDLEAVLRHGEGRSDLLRHVAKQAQVTPPGTHFRYSTFTFDLLTEALGVALGAPFEALLQRSILDPLGMTDTTFDPRPHPDRARRAAPVAVADLGSQPTDGAELVAAYTALRLAGGGLWSTASDLLRFGRAMLRGGELDGVRVLSPAFLELMTREVTAPRESTAGGLGAMPDPLTGEHYAIGWGKPGVASPASSGAFGHGGISGTRLWIDPAYDLAYVYLTGSWGLPRTPIDAVESAIYAALS